MTDPSSTSAPPLDDSHDRDLGGLNLEGITDFFLQDFRGRLAQDNGRFVGVAGHSSGDQFEILPKETIPLAGGQDHHLGILDAHQLHDKRAGGGDVRKPGDTVSDGGIKWLWASGRCSYC